MNPDFDFKNGFAVKKFYLLFRKSIAGKIFLGSGRFKICFLLYNFTIITKDMRLGIYIHITIMYILLLE